METAGNKNLQDYFTKLDTIDAEHISKVIESKLTDADIELFVRHLEEFYGIEDEEELGVLAQVMISGYMAAKYDSKEITL